MRLSWSSSFLSVSSIVCSVRLPCSSSIRLASPSDCLVLAMCLSSCLSASSIFFPASPKVLSRDRDLARCCPRMPAAAMISSGSESTLKTSATCATASPKRPAPPQMPPRTWDMGTRTMGLDQLTMRPSRLRRSWTQPGRARCFRSTQPSPTLPACSSSWRGPKTKSFRARRLSRKPFPKTSSSFVAKVSVSLKRQGQSWTPAPALALSRLVSKSPNSVSFLVEPSTISRNGR
mmetsp:Transcript_52164/g.144429  ORF Transcript_52164/g.144429 Transcript_52164/m.144429 type:complete len:233 (-) Transcript_52164:259-957(-)